MSDCRADNIQNLLIVIADSATSRNNYVFIKKLRSRTEHELDRSSMLEIPITDAVTMIVVGKMKGMMTSTMTMMKMRVDTDRPEAEAAAWVDQWPSD